MTNKEIKRLDVINRTLDGSVTVKDAAIALGISERQVLRLKKKVRYEGAQRIVHKSANRIPHNAISEETRETILKLAHSEPFSKCNFCHFREILSEKYSINISYSCLYGILKADGIDSPKKRRRFKPHRRRARRDSAGLLLQVDATSFAWFQDNRRKYALHGAIDDATGQITGLYMTKNECLAGYFNMLRRTIENYGVPCSIYADRHTIFQSPNAGKAEFEQSLTINDTQFGRALKELSIDLIAARSPQAKGRVERLWQTLQSRLPVEFALNNISDVDAANKFLERYIYTFNSEFAVEPKDTENLFRTVDTEEKLDNILCVRERRKLDNGGTFSYKKKQFKVIETMDTGDIPPRAFVDVLVDDLYGIRVMYNNTVFEVMRYVSPQKRKFAEAKLSHRQSHPIPDSHCYKYGDNLYNYADSYLTDKEILHMLDEVLFGNIYAQKRAVK